MNFSGSKNHSNRSRLNFFDWSEKLGFLFQISDFFSLHSGATELKKAEIGDKNTILQPIEKSLNDFNNSDNKKEQNEILILLFY